MKKIFAIIGVLVLLSTIVLSGCSEQKTPVIYSFRILPPEIEFGETAYMYWNVSDATSVSIDNGIGSVTLSGNRSITPSQTTTYTLTAKSSTSTVTATTILIITQSNENISINMTQTNFYIEIIEMKNTRIRQSDVSIIVINKNSTENETSILQPMITEGNGNTTFLGVGDFITFHNLSSYPFRESWDIQMFFKGKIIAQCIFKNPEGPYDIPVVRMTQSNSSIKIIGIINGPLEQTLCSVNVINETSKINQTAMIGAMFTDGDSNPNLLGVGDQITFGNLKSFKVGDRWIIELVYKGDIIGQCRFTNPGDINLIPT